ncbi:hypothetical protein HELRODRAFT_115941 [Helobdella robusta]|uniref:Acyltransferase n=1 Tax=Helobdella robusta TaxID=6412 RepID=T1EGB9_HELRO|nr:hypothetical protein HELRODRAFT_115941 [Helobdella robusta]ESN92323.1 hypothetical protein HELRODRAFT_115941 [Helobdella robusta]
MAITFFSVTLKKYFTALKMFFSKRCRRNLETFVTVLWTFSVFLVSFTGVVLFFCLLCSSYYYLALFYVVWFVYDFKTCEQGGRAIGCLKRSKIWDYLRDYFPAKLHKTEDFEKNNNYMLIYHPHGIAASAVFTCLTTGGTGVSKLFEGFTFRPLTLRCFFFCPFSRDYLTSFGLCAASKESIHHLLTKCGTNNALVLVVGGNREALEANPGNFNLVLSRRKGFVKLALQHGTPLVPVYSFGETDLYSQIMPQPGSKLHAFQQIMLTHLTFAPPFFYGLGLFGFKYGILPYRKPVNVVVGSPLKVPTILDPSDDEINEWHKKYVDRLVDHFEKHKLQFGLKEDDHLNIL